MLRTLILSAFVVLFTPAAMRAQVSLSALEGGAMAGNILQIYPDMPETSMQRSAYVGLRWGGPSPYRELFGSPENGVAFSFHDLGNSEVLGYGLGLQYQLSWNKYFSRRWRGFARWQMGGIFVTKPYDFIDNPQNNVFGSSFSALISAHAGMRYKRAQSAITLQASYWHSSNAHTVLPNVGMNTPMLMLGFERYFWVEDVYVIDTAHRPYSVKNEWGIQLYGGLGINEAGGTVRPTNGEKYFKHLAGFGATYRYKTIHRLSFMVEGYRDQTYALWNETLEWSQDRPFLGSSALMLMVGHEWIYGHFGLLIQAGVNLYNPTLYRLIGDVEQPTFSNRLKSIVPGRFALRYYVNKDEHHPASFFAQIAVKSNMGQADFLELGIGTLISGRRAK